MKQQELLNKISSDVNMLCEGNKVLQAIFENYFDNLTTACFKCGKQALHGEVWENGCVNCTN